MANHTLRLRMAAAMVVLLTNPTPPAPAQAQDDRALQVDALFGRYDRQDSPGAAVVVVQNGEVVLRRDYGSANLELGVPISPRTVFHVGSVSKQFTAFSILLLEEQGRLSLDDDVRRYVPEVPDFVRPITLRHLLHHQSGLREQESLLQMCGISTADVIETRQILSLVRARQETTVGDSALGVTG